MAYLYGEMNESETRAFELHLRACGNCREELASFGVVRESITAWRDEALSGFVLTPSIPSPAKKSALAALRQFFDLSPLWLKAATGFAVVAFCMLVGVLVAGNKKEPAVATNTYTQQQVDQLIADALAKQTEKPVEKAPEAVVVVAKPPQPKPRMKTRDRRPLSRAEREQLAADLRLMPDEDDADLLDRMNRFED